VAVDQRGFGDSDRPESGYAIPEMGADVIAFFDALQINRATLVGYSFGSFVARQAAIAQPERVAALALIGTGFAASTPAARELQNVLRDLPDPIPVEFARDFQASTVYPVPTGFFEDRGRKPEAAATPLASRHRSADRVRRPAVGRSRRFILASGSGPLHGHATGRALDGL
jgi:pimeloyl-ACP methyl ester carboxylesterase